MKARFTRDEIAIAALELVDARGLSALSMRSLATALGTGPMTLYNYVTDKEGLEELVVTAVLATVPAPESSADWRADVERIARGIWIAVDKHPAAIPLVLTRRVSSPAGFAVIDALIAALGRGGLDGENRLAAFRAVLGFALGSAQAGLGADPQGAATRIGTVAGDGYPNVAALAEVAKRTSPTTEFELGIAMLLDGIAMRARAR
ncbi:TetR/AcrR family transcriptional regulator [Mycobacteroides salmoniphilum]|uniref:Tetracycline repressor protein class E n=1 Tax=Mycobacteroides salmoniphilum TaxID=404941 RepID=A0A4R8SJV5_9MYCO|nr:TetR/AcrR family transcriptional regulator C-terminal domain-containing protein [Mycobacteroides salmoniphilum]TDZ97490.1 Tetracycline repressor protein class E [Mycobacteroides salmoniphilum]TEA01720.1 Tetracycline repressor protein class E [Mycobacteroides salmoniphilum]